MKLLRVVVLKPSKYAANGTVERFRRGFMPNSTLPHIRSMTPDRAGGSACRPHAIDESVQTDLEYFKLLDPAPDKRVLLASSACRAISSTARSISPPTPSSAAPAA